jgi:hypothetical protein
VDICLPGKLFCNATFLTFFWGSLIMGPLVTGVIALACVVSGALVGMIFRRHVPNEYQGADSKEVVRLVMGVALRAIWRRSFGAIWRQTTLVKFQQRYVMSHRNVVNCRWAKAFGQFCSSHGDHPVSRSVLGA